MKQQNFLFVDIVSSIFLLIILVANFMGLLYITDGNIVMSLLGSMFLVVCYFFVIQLLKKNKEEMIKKKFLHSSLLFWVFFILLAFVSFNLMSHFINIEYKVKSKIQQEATTKIDLVDNAALLYKTRANQDIQNFESKLDSLLKQYKVTKSNVIKSKLEASPYNMNSNLLNNPEYLNPQSLVLAKATPFQLKIDNNIKNIDSTLNLNNKKYLSVFNNWKRLSLVNSYTKLNEYVENSVDLINSKVVELPLDNSKIIVEFDKEQLPLNKPSELNILYPPNYTIPLIAVLIIHLFILIPFFTEKIKAYQVKSDRGVLDPLEIENVREI
ncbi:hypothetical protein FLGE108171_14635 [Flavobacterium gelidilacus]|uniref:hypothetical protein n=1 Tax=Flavobacterium gelidilacus TaxID=206041 RepID=UPI00047BF180|nr:hypothetical protein [Flavobacterium gelidilacus]